MKRNKPQQADSSLKLGITWGSK